MNCRYYYWDNEFRTKDKEECLQTCADKYGIGHQKLFGIGVMDVIFLDSSKSFSNSWCLRMYSNKKKTSVPFTLYEPNKVYSRYPF